MKIIYCLVSMLFCVSVLAPPGFAAADYQRVAAREGVEALVQYNPLGPNNLIVAYVKFVNKNRYGVDVDWKPIITCEGGERREGYSEGFSMDEGGTYEVTIWRSSACGSGALRSIGVQMTVKKAGF